MSHANARLPTLDEDVDPEAAVNMDGLSLRDYVSASVGAAQANMLRIMEDRLAVMIPQAIRDSMGSQANTSFDHVSGYRQVGNQAPQMSGYREPFFQGSFRQQPPQSQQFQQQPSNTT